jgi:putative ABC transport system permease protein
VGLGYTYVESKLPVLAIHPNPYRFLAYVDISHADLFDLQGITNNVSIVPKPGTTAEQLQRRLFGRPGVAAVEAIADVAKTIRKAIEDSLGILDVVEVAVLLLAVLIAFNSTSISADERRREHATMFAFGLPVGRVMWLTVIESTIIGALGTVSGIVLGQLILTWLVKVLLPTTAPDIGIVIDVSVRTYLTAALLGTIAVGLAPLLTIRRYRGMDIPSNLRVVE